MFAKTVMHGMEYKRNGKTGRKVKYILTTRINPNYYARHRPGTFRITFVRPYTMGSFLGFLYRQLTFKPKPLAATVKLDGKTVLITGANAGLGLEAAKELAAHGVKRLIITARDAAKGQAAKDQILSTQPEVEVEVWPLDYESFESIEEFGKRIADIDRLDIAILNAGVKFTDRVLSKTGHEAHIQVSSYQMI